MEIDSPCEDIRTGKPLKRQLCPISTSTNGFHFGSHPTVLHGVQHDVDDMHIRVYLLLHVIILILHLSRDSILTVLLLHLVHTLLDERLAVFEALAVVGTVVLGVLPSPVLDVLADAAKFVP